MVHLIPISLLNCGQDQHQVGAHAKIGRLVADHHRIKIFAERLQPGVHHLHGVATNGVHLGVKFQAKHTIAQIDQARTRVLFHFLLARFEGRQEDDARPLRERAIAA